MTIRRSNLFWGIVLLSVGSLLLLDNLGVFAFLNVSVWQLIWPSALIALGIWIVWASSHAQAVFETEELDIPLDGAEQARIVVEFGAGELSIRGNVEPGTLLAGTFDGVKHSLSREGGRAQIRLNSPSIIQSPAFIGLPYGPNFRRKWDFNLSDSLPINLTVKTGASDNKLDLSNLRVTKLRLESGASSTHVTLPARAGYTEMRGSSGAASVELRVPQGVAACIRTTGALSSVSVDKNRFPYTEGAYQSADYALAENKVDIKIDIGVGSLNVS